MSSVGEYRLSQKLVAIAIRLFYDTVAFAIIACADKSTLNKMET
jgi:hypothetical protein